MHAMKSTRYQRKYLPCDDVATEKLGSTGVIHNRAKPKGTVEEFYAKLRNFVIALSGHLPKCGV